ncbi:MAG TPA: PP2C family serine/threonine-protein phosphatase [Pyrinomonadaceae bacterium]|nr:PP2C family serine/threonine-protein phosphatase [Pyrinomonadaceae bacterium]
MGTSVRGAAHERNGLPNQDAIYWLPSVGHGESIVLAAADGHGSARYPRSHIGAALAVEKATQLTDEFLQSQASVENLSLIKHATEEWLPRALVRNWSEAVAEHLKSDPLSPYSIDAESSVAYGATLLVVAVSERFVLYMQLGDGEILTVSETGEVVRPLAKDERLFGNETTSLCAPEAWRDFRVGFQPLTQSRPALILLSTDGYPNSFRDEAGFLQVGSDILQMIRENGLASVKGQLEGWLRDSTRAGSGDDVTLGILCSLDT